MNIEEFYKTFGIKERDLYGCGWQADCPYGDLDCKECPYYEKYATEYPPITDRILLELICLHSTWTLPRLCATNIEALKRQVLRDLICEDCDKLRGQVQKLFEGAEDERLNP